MLQQYRTLLDLLDDPLTPARLATLDAGLAFQRRTLWLPFYAVLLLVLSAWSVFGLFSGFPDAVVYGLFLIGSAGIPALFLWWGAEHGKTFPGFTMDALPALLVFFGLLYFFGIVLLIFAAHQTLHEYRGYGMLGIVVVSGVLAWGLHRFLEECLNYYQEKQGLQSIAQTHCSNTVAHMLAEKYPEVRQYLDIVHACSRGEMIALELRLISTWPRDRVRLRLLRESGVFP